QRIGVTTKKRSPSMLLAVNVYSPDGRFDNLYVSNYATIHIRDAISRLEGVGEAAILGGRDYSMRIWLDPEKLAAREMTATDVTRAIQEQNAEIAAGRLGEPPVSPGKAVSFQVPVNARG